MAEFPMWELLKEIRSFKYRYVQLAHECFAEACEFEGAKPDVRYAVLFGMVGNTFKVQPQDIDLFAPATVSVAVGPATPTGVTPWKEYGCLVRRNEYNSVYPLCVIDVHDKVKSDGGYALKLVDVNEFETKYGQIPEGAFVAIRSDWCKSRLEEGEQQRETVGDLHYPAWDVEALKFLIEVRNVEAVGYETPQMTPCDQRPEFSEEDCLIRQGKTHIGGMRNLDQVPPMGSLIFCAYPNVAGWRCFAIVPAIEQNNT